MKYDPNKQPRKKLKWGVNHCADKKYFSTRHYSLVPFLFFSYYHFSLISLIDIALRVELSYSINKKYNCSVITEIFQ